MTYFFEGKHLVVHGRKLIEVRDDIDDSLFATITPAIDGIGIRFTTKYPLQVTQQPGLPNTVNVVITARMPRAEIKFEG